MYACSHKFRQLVYEMNRQSKLALISAACFLTLLIFLGYFVSQQSGSRLTLTFGDTTFDITLLGFFAIKPILAVAAIAFIIQGFRVHWLWGLANIFLFPLAGIALFITHRREGKIPMIILALGTTLLVVVLICASIGI
jgi:hypothetical protein